MIKLKKTKKNSSDGPKVRVIVKDKNRKVRLTSFGKTVVICLSIIVALLISLIIAVNALIGYYYGLMDYTDISSESLLGDDEISKLLGDEQFDPTGTGENGELSDQLGDAVSEVENVKEDINGVLNILLLGVDNSGVSGDTSGWANSMHTDSMIVCSINTKTKKIVLTSIMRDSFVEIVRPNGTIVNNRINTAYIFGGYKGLFDTIERNMAIDVEKFVQVDFSSFIEIVNILGGVDMYVSSNEAYEMNNVLHVLNSILGDRSSADKLKDTSSGVKHLNGKQALAYARIRHNAGDDFGRTERQRKLIMTVAEEVKGLSVSQLNTLLTTLLKKVSTNMTQAECTSLMANALSYLNYEIVSFRIPTDDTYYDINVNGASMLNVDFVENYKIWKSLVTGKDS